jgi:peptide/nickel transport system substrate-binding protein
MSIKRRTLLRGSAAAAALAPSFAIGQPKGARTLKFVPQAALTVLDPVFTTAQPSVAHGWAIYDLLFGMNGKFEPKPQMAEGYTVSDDGRTYLITLREGLKFHNGEPVRAQDCAPSLKRWAARETIGQTVGQFVEEWGVKDDRTVRIQLRRPVPSLIPAIARGGASVAFMMPEHVAKTDPFKQISDTTGSGPYRFLKDEFVVGAEAAYARNPDYVPRQEPAEWTAGGKVAHFDRIEWKAIPDSATAAAALMSNEVDWYEHVQPDLAPMLRKDPDIAFGLSNPTGYNAVLRFNHLHPPFDNVMVRRAVMMAVNQRDYMVSVTGDDPSIFTTCKSMFPCGTKYGQELGVQAMGGSIEKAQALLKASGYKGEKVVILSPTDLVTVGPLGDVTNDILKKIGMNVELVATDWGTVVQRRTSREPVEKGGWSIIHTWGPSTIRFTPAEHSQIRGLGPTAWFGWYKDEVIEQMTRDFLLAETDAGRDALANAIHARAFDQVPSVPLGLFQIRTAYLKSLKGVIEATGPYFWNVRRV